MSNQEIKNIEVNDGVLTLQLIAKSMNATAEQTALVLQSLTDEDLEFVVDTIVSSDNEADLDRASNIFTEKLQLLK